VTPYSKQKLNPVLLNDDKPSAVPSICSVSLPPIQRKLRGAARVRERCYAVTAFSWQVSVFDSVELDFRDTTYAAGELDLARWFRIR